MELQAKGVSWSLEPSLQAQAAYLATSKQHREAKSHAVISEFKHTIQVTVPADTVLPEIVGENVGQPLEGLPIGQNWCVFSIYSKRGVRMP